MKSWKTTLAGVSAVLATIAHIAKVFAEQGVPGLATIDWTSSLAAVAAGWGLLHARDHSVTSEQAGVADVKIQINKPKPTPYSTLLLLALCSMLCCGCAMTRTTQTETDADGTKRKTGFTGITFFDSKSELAKARTTMTEKSQGVSISGLSSESSGSNAVSLVESAIGAAVKAAVKSAVPVP